MNRLSDPITYILDRLKSGHSIEKFDVLNAADHWDKLRNRLPVAYAKRAKDGRLYDPRLTNNPYENQNYVVPLFD
jgi:hypothetical protein